VPRISALKVTVLRAAEPGLCAPDAAHEDRAICRHVGHATGDEERMAKEIETLIASSGWAA